MAHVRSGHVYVLTSPNSDFVKIGGIDHLPVKRIKEINASSPYRALGPWSAYDFRQVNDWMKVESSLHYAFRSSLVRSIEGQRELFDVKPQVVASKLLEIDPSEIVGRPKIDRLFQDQTFAAFLLRFFRFTGVMNFLHLQGAWVFVLFPTTSGGRYYTISVGRHEVAYCTLPKALGDKATHVIVVDRLVLEFPEVLEWVRAHDGGVADSDYKSALPRAVSVSFSGGFDEALELLSKPGLRRALIAYWGEALIDMEDRGVVSVYGRHHNYNAVAELRRRMSLPVEAVASADPLAS